MQKSNIKNSTKFWFGIFLIVWFVLFWVFYKFMLLIVVCLTVILLSCFSTLFIIELVTVISKLITYFNKWLDNEN